MDKIERSTRGRKQRAIGIDLGVRNLAILSNGVAISHHPSLPRLRHNLEHFAKKLEGQKPKSKRWLETVRIIAKTQEQIENCQKDHADKLANTLTKHYKVIIIEDGYIGPTILNNEEYAQAVEDASWEFVRTALRRKCAERHCTFVEVKPYFTTQECSRCQNRQKMPLGERTYTCPKCGLVIDRDVNAAINIKKKGLTKLNRQRKARANVGPAPF